MASWEFKLRYLLLIHELPICHNHSLFSLEINHRTVGELLVLVKLLDTPLQPLGGTSCRLVLSFKLLGDIGFRNRISDLRGAFRISRPVLDR